MSIEPEDMLEEALRNDFPTPNAQARVRRRLVAAGVAVGNGVAATTAAASGVGTAGVAGAAGKLAGLSWGLKLGLAAMVTIPSVGLWLEGRADQPPPVRSRPAPRASAAEARAQAAQSPDAPSHTPDANANDVAPLPEPPKLRAAKSAVEGAPARTNDAAPSPGHPSQGDFAPLEPPARTPQTASTLAEETRLLDGAFAALAAGNRAHAAELIRQHEARFPSGLLQKERERAKTRLSEMSRGE